MSSTFRHALEITRVSAASGRGTKARTTLSPVSMRISPGESVAVVGRSGAGKSTLADIILGLRAPSGGEVSVRGEAWCSPSTHPSRGRRHLVQGVPQDPSAAFVPRWTLGESIRRAVRSLTGEHDRSWIDQEIRQAAEQAHLDIELLDRRPAEVSGGQAQRAAITRALAVGPAVLVADEPTSALDPETARAVTSSLLTIIAESQIALLLVTHDPEVASGCMRTFRITTPEEDTLETLPRSAMS